MHARADQPAQCKHAPQFVRAHACTLSMKRPLWISLQEVSDRRIHLGPFRTQLAIRFNASWVSHLPRAGLSAVFVAGQSQPRYDSPQHASAYVRCLPTCRQTDERGIPRDLQRDRVLRTSCCAPERMPIFGDRVWKWREIDGGNGDGD